MSTSGSPSHVESNTETILEVESVSKYFGGIVALQDCSLRATEGRITGLIGPNGSGKSTLFNVICGDYSLTDGEIRFRGERINGVPKHERHLQGIGRSYQEVEVFPELSLIENVQVASMPKRMTQTVRDFLIGNEKTTTMSEEEAIGILERVQLDHRKDHFAEEVSYGQTKLLQMAMTVATGCDLILLDEPTAGVNPTTTNKIMDFVSEENENGTTFLLIDHNIEIIMEYSDVVYALSDGHVISHGTPEAVRDDEDVRESYLGE